MENYNEIFQWYISNNILDIISDVPFNHITDNSIKNNITQKNTKINIENKINEKTKLKEKEKNNLSNNNDSYDLTYIYQSEKDIINKHIKNIKNITFDKNIEELIKNLKNELFDIKTVEDLKNKINNFEYFLNIKHFAINTIFGDGNINSNILFIDTKIPGTEEDKYGKSLLGENGILFDNMLKTINLDRNKLFIINTFFWKTIGNKELSNEELEISKLFVEKYISLINPKLIVFLGSNFDYYINTGLTITKSREKIYKYTNQYLNDKQIDSIIFFHPEYILNQPNKKREYWYDLLFLKKILINLL